MAVKFIKISTFCISAMVITLAILSQFQSFQNPLSQKAHLEKESTSNPDFVTSVNSRKRSLDNGVDLKILPLGDSITWGFQSTDGNGYRLDLLNMLAGNPVQYVGSQRSGTMADNYNEGHPGATISEITGYAMASLPERPNVILLMAGTNDCNGDVDPGGAPARLGSLIDECISACPDAVILVAQLTPIANQQAEALVETFNAAVPGIVATRADAGKHVLTVDMSSYVNTGDLYDGLHPNDAGYNLMAECWYAGLQAAAANGWINTPVPVSGDRHGTCTSGVFWDPDHGEIASGVGTGDAPFKADWIHVGQLASGNVGSGHAQGPGVRLADMFGNGIDSYLWVNETSGAVTLYSNAGYSAGSVTWIDWGEIAGGIGDGPGVMFADLDGDGIDDFIWVSTTGDVTAYRNGGPGSGGPGAKTWIWYPLGTISSGLGGGTRASIRFADIDGDGRAEYHVIGSDGSVLSWFNSGYGSKPTWEPMGIIATGTGSSDLEGVHLVDLNGDGKADYLWLSPSGAATAYINLRGHTCGLAPTWVSYGVIAGGIGVSRENVTFGDLNGDGKVEYIGVNYTTGALNVYLNGGSGATFVTADGLRFADLNGDGLDDYLWLDKDTGAMTAYLNGGWDTDDVKQLWYPQNVIATGVGAQRDDIR
jgi:lysophospholipase L1-like esterase